MSTQAIPITPGAFAAMCGDRQKHDSRAQAQIEANNKHQITGRRHKVEGCGICLNFHAFPVHSTAQLKRRNKKGQRRRGWSDGMGE